MGSRFRLTAAVLGIVLAAGIATAQRRDVFIASRDHEAIQYSSGPTTDAIAALNRKIQSGAVSLTFEPTSGWLRSALSALDVPVESQTLVFSQTSFQGPRINILNPRALYFNDTVSVGWVRGGDILEVAVQDPKQGVVFYTLDQDPSSAPRFTRNNSCVACHLSWETLGVPGLTVQSVHPLPDDKSYVNGYTTTHGSPLNQRWGGWWVTGNHGGARHMGNIPVMPVDKGKARLASPQRPLASVEGLFDTKGYPSTHSDVVALLVLEHQSHMTNHITRTAWEARLAEAEPSEDARQRVREAASELVDYMLFVWEAPFAGPVRGSTGFAKVFAASGPRDSKGRSLRDLDLGRRLLKYPCSYMIYTAAFDAMPKLAKEAVYARMWEVLSGRDTHERYRILAPGDRRAIVEILRETKKDLPSYFKS